MNLETPTRDGSWLTFNNAIFDDINTMDCNDTINGKCEYTNNALECLEICKESKDCDAGYYMEYLDKKICVPLFKFNWDSSINQIYKIRSKNIYKELTDFKEMKTFINSDTYTYPPKQGNSVFFLDTVYLHNIETGSDITYKNNNNIAKFLPHLKKDTKHLIDTHTNIQISQVNQTNQGLQYRLLKYGDYFSINIPGSQLILRRNPSSNEILEEIFKIYKDLLKPYLYHPKKKEIIYNIQILFILFILILILYTLIDTII
jgi:hypothetical protein